jgi:hypothetical protein
MRKVLVRGSQFGLDGCLEFLQGVARNPLAVAGELGAGDAERDLRGFGLKFYTEESNWDLAGNHCRKS